MSEMDIDALLARAESAALATIANTLAKHVPVRTHTRLLTRYANTFTGCDGVATLVRLRLASDVLQAISLANEMLRAGFLVHAKDPSQPFKHKEHSLYRLWLHGGSGPDGRRVVTASQRDAAMLDNLHRRPSGASSVETPRTPYTPRSSITEGHDGSGHRLSFSSLGSGGGGGGGSAASSRSILSRLRVLSLLSRSAAREGSRSTIALEAPAEAAGARTPAGHSSGLSVAAAPLLRQEESGLTDRGHRWFPAREGPPMSNRESRAVDSSRADRAGMQGRHEPQAGFVHSTANPTYGSTVVSRDPSDGDFSPGDLSHSRSLPRHGDFVHSQGHAVPSASRATAVAHHDNKTSIASASLEAAARDAHAGDNRGVIGASAHESVGRTLDFQGDGFAAAGDAGSRASADASADGVSPHPPPAAVGAEAGHSSSNALPPAASASPHQPAALGSSSTAPATLVDAPLAGSGILPAGAAGQPQRTHSAAAVAAPLRAIEVRDRDHADEMRRLLQRIAELERSQRVTHTLLLLARERDSAAPVAPDVPPTAVVETSPPAQRAAAVAGAEMHDKDATITRLAPVASEQAAVAAVGSPAMASSAGGSSSTTADTSAPTSRIAFARPLPLSKRPPPPQVRFGGALPVAEDGHPTMASPPPLGHCEQEYVSSDAPGHEASARTSGAGRHSLGAEDSDGSSTERSGRPSTHGDGFPRAPREAELTHLASTDCGVMVARHAEPTAVATALAVTTSAPQCLPAARVDLHSCGVGAGSDSEACARSPAGPRPRRAPAAEVPSRVQEVIKAPALVSTRGHGWTQRHPTAFATLALACLAVLLLLLLATLRRIM